MLASVNKSKSLSYLNFFSFNKMLVVFKANCRFQLFSSQVQFSFKKNFPSNNNKKQSFNNVNSKLQNSRYNNSKNMLFKRVNKEFFIVKKQLKPFQYNMKYYSLKKNLTAIEKQEYQELIMQMKKIIGNYNKTTKYNRSFIMEKGYLSWHKYFMHKHFKLAKIFSFKRVKKVSEAIKTWNKFQRYYKYLKVLWPKYIMKESNGFLTIPTNEQYGRYIYGVGLKQYYRRRYFLQRQKIDNRVKILVAKQQYRYKNFFWVRKTALETRKYDYILRNYRYLRGYKPFINVHKKHKIYYNWGDKQLFKRFPIYRYKYNILFKFPRFADYRRLFKNQLREQHVFRWLYRLKFSQLVKAFRKSTYNTKRNFELMFLKHFEYRLDTIVYRLNFAFSLKQARQLVNRGLFLVNNKVVDSFRYHVSLGDVIMPILRLRMIYGPGYKRFLNIYDHGVSLSTLRLFWRQLQADQYPEYLMLNERIPAGMLIGNVNTNNLRYNRPFSVQFLTLSLLKYS